MQTTGNGGDQRKLQVWETSNALKYKYDMYYIF